MVLFWNSKKTNGAFLARPRKEKNSKKRYSSEEFKEMGSSVLLFSSAAFIWLAPEKNSKKRKEKKRNGLFCSAVFFCFFSLL